MPAQAGAAEAVGPCLEVIVRMAEGGTYRLRVDGAALDADGPAAAGRVLRDRMAARGVLAVRGRSGVRLHLAAERVKGVRVERCPAVATGGSGRP